MPAPKDGISDFCAMLRLCVEQALGGRLEPDVAENVADGAAYAFIGAFGGTCLYIPKSAPGELERRNREIYRAWISAPEHDHPDTLRKLIARHALSENQIYKIIRTERQRRIRAKQASESEVQEWRHNAA